MRAFAASLAIHASRVRPARVVTGREVGEGHVRAEALQIRPVVAVGDERLVRLRHRALAEAQGAAADAQARSAVGHGSVAEARKERVAVGRREVAAQPLGQRRHVPGERQPERGSARQIVSTSPRDVAR